MPAAGTLVVRGGTVLTPAGPVAGDVVIRSGRITDVLADGDRPARRGDTGDRRADGSGRVEGAERDEPSVPEVIDAAGCLVAPGFVDLQCNGAVGVDLATEPDRLWEVAAALPRWGVTAWLPTIVSGPPDVRRRALTALRAGPPEVAGPVARPLGLHLEGPFLAPERRGAHPVEHLRAPDPAVVASEDWSAAAGVALVTLAPELPGALDVVHDLRERGVVVAAGHSSASADQATAAIDAGVRMVTHVFNAMAPLHHRAPGLAGVALADERVRVGAIVDGIHLHPTTVAVLARTLGDRLCLVTDAVAALGSPRGGRSGEATDRAGGADRADSSAGSATSDGSDRSPGSDRADRDGVRPGDGRGRSTGDRLHLGGRAVAVDEAGVRLADGTLAGSDLSLDRAVRNLVTFAGVPLRTAVAAATATPAAVLAEGDRVRPDEAPGAVVPGAPADLVLLDPDGGVVATLLGGVVAHDRRRSGT